MERFHHFFEALPAPPSRVLPNAASKVSVQLISMEPVYYVLVLITALTIPSAHAAGEYASIRFRLLVAISARNPKSPAKRAMAAASPEGSRGGTTNPFQPSCTKSRAHPATPVTIIGSAHAIASFTTRPQGSL